LGPTTEDDTVDELPIKELDQKTKRHALIMTTIQCLTVELHPDFGVGAIVASGGVYSFYVRSGDQLYTINAESQADAVNVRSFLIQHLHRVWHEEHGWPKLPFDEKAQAHAEEEEERRKKELEYRAAWNAFDAQQRAQEPRYKAFGSELVRSATFEERRARGRVAFPSAFAPGQMQALLRERGGE
jgi:hypothetical protein